MPDFTPAEAEAVMARTREYLEQSTNYEGRKPLPTEIMLAEIDRLRAARDELVAGLEAIYDTARRKDWQMKTYTIEDTFVDLDMIGGKARPLIAKHGNGT